MRFYLLLSNYLKRKIELQRTEISLLSLSLFLNSTTGKAKYGIWHLKRQELWFDEMWQKRSNKSYQKDWKTDFRMTRKIFKKLVNLVYPNLTKADTKFRKSIPVQKRVAIALWRLSTGNSFRTIAKTLAVGKSTVVSITKDFCKEMRQLSKQYIKFPVTSHKIENAIKKFKTCCNSKTPESLGATDGTHIYIKTPQCVSKYDYFCRKQRYSINTQPVAGGDLLFLNLATGFPSCLHDSRLLIHTSLFVKANDKEILAEPKKLIKNLIVCPLIWWVSLKVLVGSSL